MIPKPVTLQKLKKITMKPDFNPAREPVPVIVFGGTAWEAALVKTMLEDEEIEAFLKDEILGSYDPSQITPGGAGSVKVVVSNIDVERAKEIVERYYQNIK